MANTTAEFSQELTEASRRIASRQGEAISKYGELLTKLGSRELDAVDFTRESMQLGVEAGARLAEDAVKVSVAYWRLVADILGTAITPPAAPAKPPKL